MQAAPEGEVVPHVRAVQVDLVRAGEDGLVPVTRPEQQQQRDAGRQDRAAQLDLARGDPEQPAVRGVPAQRLLGQLRDRPGRVGQDPLADTGVLQHDQHGGRDRVAGGVKSGHPGRAADHVVHVLVGHAGIAVRAVDQVRDQVLAGLGAPVLDQRLQVAGVVGHPARRLHPRLHRREHVPQHVHVVGPALDAGGVLSGEADDRTDHRLHERDGVVRHQVGAVPCAGVREAVDQRGGALPHERDHGPHPRAGEPGVEHPAEPDVIGLVLVHHHGGLGHAARSQHVGDLGRVVVDHRQRGPGGERPRVVEHRGQVGVAGHHVRADRRAELDRA
jgi:hypothetical protein